jgi:hypothetical protein
MQFHFVKEMADVLKIALLSKEESAKVAVSGLRSVEVN